MTTGEGEVTEQDDEPVAVPVDPMQILLSAAQEPRSLRNFPQVTKAAVALTYRAGPRLFWIIAVLQVLLAVFAGLQVLVGQWAISAVLDQAGGGSFSKAVVPVLAFVATTAASGLLANVQLLVQRLLTERVTKSTWTSIFEVTSAVSLETFEDPVFFDELQRIRTNAIVRPVTMTNGLFQFFGGLLSTAGVCIALISIKPILVPILLAGGLPLALLARKMGRIEFQFAVDQTPPMRVRAYLSEVITGRLEAKEIRAFDLAQPLTKRWTRSYDEYLTDLRAHIDRRLVLEALSAVVTIIATAGAIALLVHFIVEGTVPLAAAGAALIAVQLLASRVQTTFRGISILFESALFLRDFDAFLTRDRAVGNTLASGEKRPDAFTELDVQDVRFTYPGSRREALRGVSLTIRAGEVIALVGENGSGKTTLAKILGQLFDPTAGRVLWDGTDVTTLDRVALRERIGVIFQDFIRYQLSARENVEFGRIEAEGDEGRLASSVQRAGADAFLQRLPQGLDTSLGKMFTGGYDLSGGQWQRVALARAFFRDAEFLVLDEPTAALDARSEDRLFAQMRDLAEGRAVLLVSHRFSTVKTADRIYVMHDGEITEQGSHDELMAAGGRYAELFELQARLYR